MLNVLNAPQVFAPQTALPYAPAKIETEGWTIGALINIVVRRLGTVIKVAGVVIAGAVIYLLIAEPRFTATASLLPDTKRVPSAPGEVTQEALTDPAIVENQIETIRSESIALAVIDKLSLWKDPEFVGKESEANKSELFEQALTAIGLFAAGPADDIEIRRHAAADRFARMLKVTRVGRSYLTEISFTSIDPVKAARIVNLVADTYIQDQLGAKFANADRSARWMQERIAELEKQTAAAASAIEEFKKNANLDLDATGKPAIVRQQEELTASLQQAREDSAKAGAQVELFNAALRAEDRTALPDPALLDSTSDASIRKLRDDYQEAAGATGSPSPETRGSPPDNSEVSAKLTALRNAIWDAVDAAADTAKKDLEAAKLREATIARRINEAAPRLAHVSSSISSTN
jgi:polysaccharide biosynthesis transport protein